MGLDNPHPEIFRFELNSATKVEFCLLKWTAVNGSDSFQVLSIVVRLCTVVLLCNLIWNYVKERNRIFALQKKTNNFKISAYFSSKIDRNAPMTIPEHDLLDVIGF